jgi:hypothetical protein
VTESPMRLLRDAPRCWHDNDAWGQAPSVEFGSFLPELAGSILCYLARISQHFEFVLPQLSSARVVGGETYSQYVVR